MLKHDWRDKIKNLKVNKPGRFLVFESTGFALYGVLAKCGVRSPFVLSETAVSKASDFATAIGEVLELLCQKVDEKLPKKAILITPSAAGQLLRLPIDPQKPKTHAQIGEMARWELEEFFVRHNDIWSPGSLLMGRGCITPEQRRNVEEASSSGQRLRSASIYGEIAAREHIDECLELMERLVAPDDDLAIGYSPHAEEEDEGPFAWWSAAIGASIRDRWAEAFRRNGLFLAWIYPQLGAAVSHLAYEEDAWLLVDVRQEQFGLFKGRGAKLISAHIKNIPFGHPDPAAIAESARSVFLPNTGKIFVSAPPEVAASISEELLLFGAETFSLFSLFESKNENNEEACPPGIMVSLEGSARHALGLCPASALVRISAQPPAPPIWKNKEMYPWLVIGILLIAMSANEYHMRSKAAQKELELAKAEIEHDRRAKMTKELQQSSGAAKRLETELKSKEEILQEERRLKNVFDTVIRHRQELVPGILRSIAEAVNDDVALDKVDELDNGKGFYIEGIAIRDTSGQFFVSKLNENLAPWEYKVGETQFSRAKGRLGIDWVILKIWLVKTAEKTTEP